MPSSVSPHAIRSRKICQAVQTRKQGRKCVSLDRNNCCRTSSKRNSRRICRTFIHMSSEGINQQGCNQIKRLSNDANIERWFNIGELIGKGSFSDVFLAVRRSDSTLCALKRIEKFRVQNQAEIVENEVGIVSRCSHVNICRFLDAFETVSTYVITFEYACNGDLFSIIKTAGKLNEHTAARITAQTANALSYLHKRAIVHRDVKPENLLLAQNFTVKLADFGLAAIVNGPLYRICGTPTYIAPEMLSQKGYGVEVDTWSLGVIVHIMLIGYAPWRCPDRKRLFRLITTSRLCFGHSAWSNISKGAKELVASILTCNVSKRVTCRDIIRNQWVISKK